MGVGCGVGAACGAGVGCGLAVVVCAISGSEVGFASANVGETWSVAAMAVAAIMTAAPVVTRATFARRLVTVFGSVSCMIRSSSML